MKTTRGKILGVAFVAGVLAALGVSALAAETPAARLATETPVAETSAAAPAAEAPTVTSAAETPTPPPAAEAPMVTLNLPEDLDLKVLIDYVGKRQNISFIYDERLGNMRVTIKAPKELPADSLLSLLDSALKMKGFMMAPTDMPGMIRIEPSKPLTADSIGPHSFPEASLQGQANLAMTRVFELRYASSRRVEQVIKPFLSAATANITPLDETGMVIVTDYASNMKRLEELLAVVDRPSRVVVRFVPITHLEAMPLTQQVMQVLAAKAKGGGAAKGEVGGVTVLADERANQVAVVGTEEEVAEAMELIRSLDVSLGLETRAYTFSIVSPEQVDRLIRKQIGELAAKRFYKSATDPDANLLIVTTTPEIHAQIETLRQSIDKPVAESLNPIRFYKLKNAKASDVLATLRGIMGTSGLAGTSVDGVSAKPPEASGLVIRGPTESQVNMEEMPGGTANAGPTGAKSAVVVLKDARVMADDATNSVIVVAQPSMHAVYEKLIERLDVLHPQVLIEATVVAIDTTNDFSLGVEFSKTTSVNGGEGTFLKFTSFGLSEVNPKTGQLTLKPGIGFNGALLNTDIADIVVHALESDSRVKVVSRPNVLINDNATGTLASESEEPFSSVNAASTVATTSFAGYASAGTKIKVTPQISEGEHLKLQYEITLSSFGDTRTDTLPPSRQTNSVAGEVTIPNGCTIVVGGLSRENATESADRVPFFGRIPVMEYLFSKRTQGVTRTTLFVFIRAVILRDDKFEDLKVVSHEAAEQAGLTGKYPVSDPVEIP